MFIRSTGLGRTLLKAKVANIETTEVVPSTLEPPKDGSVEPMRMLMVMQVVHPVNWTVRAFVEPSDLRHMIKVVLTNPMLILKGIKFLFSRDPIDATSEKQDMGAVPVPPRAPKVEGAAQAPAGAQKKGPGPMPPPRRGPGPIPPR